MRSSDENRLRMLATSYVMMSWMDPTDIEAKAERIAQAIRNAADEEISKIQKEEADGHTKEI